jgi:dTDP-6-deoxy-L-talose 4-dehydrogenase (NAD+)
MDQIIVTGASGFVGQNVVKKLLTNKIQPIAVVRDIGACKEIKALENSRLIQLDIYNEKLPPEICDNAILIHCAWDSVRDPFSMKHIEENYQSGYQFLKSAVRSGVKKIICIGTISEYGLVYGPIKPDQHTVPNTPYGFGKDMLHKSLRLLSNELKFDLIWARLFYVYGEGQNEGTVFQQLTEAISNKHSEFNCSPANQLLDYLSIDEAAKQIVELINKSAGTYNVCSGVPISLREILEMHIKNLNSNIKLNLGYYTHRHQDSIACWGVK